MLHAFIDESGNRAVSARSTDYFVMSAAIVDDADIGGTIDTLAQIRSDLGRRPGDVMSWKNIKTHTQRLRAAQLLGAAPVVISTVVVCKRHLTSTLPSEDHAYLYTLRYLARKIVVAGTKPGNNTGIHAGHDYAVPIEQAA